MKGRALSDSLVPSRGLVCKGLPTGLHLSRSRNPVRSSTPNISFDRVALADVRVCLFLSISLTSHHDNKPKNTVCRLKSVHFGCPDRFAKRSSRADKPFKYLRVTLVALDDFQCFRTKFPDFSST